MIGIANQTGLCSVSIQLLLTLMSTVGHNNLQGKHYYTNNSTESTVNVKDIIPSEYVVKAKIS